MIQRALQAVPAASNEEVPNGGIGLQGWFRALNVGRVLGLFSLYLFLDGYDARANFNRRVASRLREEARAKAALRSFRNGVGMSIVSQ